MFSPAGSRGGRASALLADVGQLRQLKLEVEEKRQRLAQIDRKIYSLSPTRRLVDGSVPSKRRQR